MKTLLRLLSIFSFIALLNTATWGQTTVFTDDFSTNTSATWTTSGAVGASAWSVTSVVDWGARRNTSPLQLELTNDASGAANVAGWTFASTTTSSFGSPYNQTLGSNTNLVTWTFNMRQQRSDPGGWTVGTYGAAFVLAATSTTVQNTGTGYAVVLGNTGATDPIRLVKFTAGLVSLGTTAPPTANDIIVSNTTGLTDFGAEYLSVKVVYSPSNNQWELFLRNDGTSAFADPTIGTLISQGTAINNAYTGTALSYMGAYWQGSTSANQTAFYDNVKVVCTPGPTTITQLSNGIATSPILSTSSNLALLGFSMVQANGTANLTAINFNTTSASLGKLTNIKLYTSTDNDYSTSGDNTQVSSVVVTQTSGQIQLSGFSEALTTTTKNFFLVADPDGSVSMSTPAIQLSFSNSDATISGGTINSATITGLNYLFVNPTDPAITVIGSALSFGPVLYGTSSTPQSFTVSGTNLSNDITVTAPSLFEVSMSSGSGYGSSVTLTQSGGTVNTTTIYVRFSPTSADGAHSGDVSNASSPATTINIAVSGKAIDTEPTTASSAIVFSNFAGTTLTVGWTVGNGTSHLVVAKAGSAVSSNPIDGTSYAPSAAFGSGNTIGTGEYVVYNSTGSSVNLTGLTKGTYYFFTIYEYNGSAGSENYLTSPTATSYDMAAATVYSNTTSGDWLTAATWSPAAVPTFGDNVVILNGHTITANVSSTRTCGKLIVNNGGVLTTTDGGISSSGLKRQIRVYGTEIINNGTMGNGIDGLSIDVYNPNTTTFSGANALNFGTIRPGTAGMNATLVIKGNVNLSYSTALQLQNATGQNFTNVTVNFGGSLTMVGTDIKTASSSDTDVLDFAPVININGTVTIGTGGNIYLRSSYGPPSINISSTGSLTINGPDLSGGGGVHLTTTTFTNPGIISGAGSFVLGPTAHIEIASADGLNPSTGQYRTTTRTFPTTASYIYVGTAAQVTGSDLPSTIGRLTINNTNGVTLSNNLTIDEFCTLTNGTFTVGAKTLTLKNPISGTATNLSADGTSSIVVAGSESGINLPSSISTLNNFELNNASGTTLQGNLTVGGVLTMTNGVVTTGVNTLTANDIVTRTSGFVDGNFAKPIAVGSPNVTYEIGTGISYAPVSLAFTGVTTGGVLTAKTVDTDHPQVSTSGLDASKSLNRYYSFTNAGISPTNYDATLTFVAGDVDGGANTSNFIVKKYDGSTWTTPTTVNPLALSIQASGLTSFSDFAVGESLPTTAAPVVSSPIVEGATSVSGTSTEADGTSIEVFVDNVSVGTATVSSNAWTLLGLTALTAGQEVKAKATASGKLESGFSNMVKVAIAAPVATSATNVNYTSFTANWSSVTGATSYRLDVYQIISGSPVYTLNDVTVSGTSNNVFDLTPGNTYYYVVRAVNAYSTSANSNEISVNVPLPVELSSFSAMSVKGNVTLNWQTVTEVNSSLFEIQRQLTNGSAWIKVGQVAAAGNSNAPKEYIFTDKNLTSNKYQYRLKMIDADGSYQYSGIVETEIAVPTEYAISQNYPNPFNPSAKIDYQLPFDSKVALELYGITGEKVATLINTDLSAGYYTADINASALNLASGVYIYRMTASNQTGQNFVQVKKLMLTK